MHIVILFAITIVLLSFAPLCCHLLYLLLTGIVVTDLMQLQHQPLTTQPKQRLDC